MKTYFHTKLTFSGFLLLLAFFTIQTSISYAQCNNPNDYAILRALYLNTNGNSWTNKKGWPTYSQFLAFPLPPQGTDLEKWEGVTCNGSRLISISLANNQLNGILPFGWSNSSFLHTITLSNNFIKGNIPEDIFSLKGLRILDLQLNALEGNLSSSLASLSDSCKVNLSNNSFSGCFPQALDKFCGKGINTNNNPLMPW